MDKALLKKLNNLGFKRKWLSDHSGYWYQFRKNKYLSFFVHVNPTRFSMEISHDDNYVWIDYKKEEQFFKSLKETKII